jgi:hypothetical protein
MVTEYTTDYYLWTEEQAHLLREGRFSEADIENIAKELEASGVEKSCKLGTLFSEIMVLLFVCTIPSENRPMRVKELDDLRDEVDEIIEKSPSLKAEKNTSLRDAWQFSAYGNISRNFQLYPGHKPVSYECPYTIEEVMDHDYIPEHE